MAVTWTISTLERNTSDDGVIVAHWRASDSEVVGEDTHTQAVLTALVALLLTALLTATQPMQTSQKLRLLAGSRTAWARKQSLA